MERAHTGQQHPISLEVLGEEKDGSQEQSPIDKAEKETGYVSSSSSPPGVGPKGQSLTDEPTTGLDPQARLRIWEVVEAFRQRGGTILLTTHYMEEAARLCDRVAILDQGRVIAQGTPEALIESLQAEQIVEFRAAGDIAEEVLLAFPGVSQVSQHNGSRLLRVSQIGEALPALM